MRHLILLLLLSGCITTPETTETTPEPEPTWNPTWPTPPTINYTDLEHRINHCRVDPHGGRISCPHHAQITTACKTTHTTGYPPPKNLTIPTPHTKNWPQTYGYTGYKPDYANHEWILKPGNKIGETSAASAIHITTQDTLIYRLGVIHKEASAHKFHRAWITEIPNATIIGQTNITPAQNNVSNYQAETTYAVQFKEPGLYAWMPTFEYIVWPKATEDSGLLRQEPMRACETTRPVWVHAEPWYGHPDYTGPPPPPPVWARWNETWPEPPEINQSQLRNDAIHCEDCDKHYYISSCQTTTSLSNEPTNPPKPPTYTRNWPARTQGTNSYGGFEWVTEPVGSNISIANASRAIHVVVGDVVTYRVGVVLQQDADASQIDYTLRVVLPDHVTHVGGAREVVAPTYFADAPGNASSFVADGVHYLELDLRIAVVFAEPGLYAWLPEIDFLKVYPREDGDLRFPKQAGMASCGATPPIWAHAR